MVKHSTTLTTAREMADSIKDDGVIYSVGASLFQYSSDNSKFKSLGQVTVSITCVAGEADRTIQQLICRDKGTGKMTCSAKIGKSNSGSVKFQMQSDNYASFRSDSGEQYSLFFQQPEDMNMLAIHIGLSIYLSAGSPSHHTTIVDVTAGKGDSLDVKDAVAVKYCAYVVEGFAIGRQYDTNMQQKKTYKFAVPSSNPNLESGMVGFEGTVIGMKQGGKRVVVIPPACKNTAGRDTLIVFVEATKVRVDTRRGAARLPAQHHLDDDDDDAPAAPVQQLTFQQFQQQQTHQAALPLSITGPPGIQQLLIPQPPPPPPPPAPVFPSEISLPPTQQQSISNTEANVAQLMSSSNDLLATVNMMNQKLDDVNCEVRKLHPPKKLSITTSQAMNNLQILLEDVGKLQDALLAKEARIRDLEAQLGVEKTRADGYALSQTELLASQQQDGASKIETDRLIVKLEDQVNHHLGSIDNVKQTLRMTEAQLKKAEAEKQEAKGQLIVAKVESESMRMKVADLNELLNSERLARDRAEERAERAEQKLAHFQETTFQKTQQLTDVTKKAEADKKHFVNLLEEERARAEEVHERMKEEMFQELMELEDKHSKDKTKLANESFTKGVDHGREVANSESRMKWESELRDLKIENGRLQAQLDTAKAEISLERSSFKSTVDRLCYPDESNQKEVEALKLHINQLQEQVGDNFEQIAKSEANLSAANTKLLLAEQKLRDTEIKCTSAVVALSRQVVPKHQLVALLQQIFRGKEGNTDFENNDDLYNSEENKKEQEELQKEKQDKEQELTKKQQEQQQALMQQQQQFMMQQQQFEMFQQFQMQQMQMQQAQAAGTPVPQPVAPTPKVEPVQAPTPAQPAAPVPVQKSAPTQPASEVVEEAVVPPVEPAKEPEEEQVEEPQSEDAAKPEPVAEADAAGEAADEAPKEEHADPVSEEGPPEEPKAEGAQQELPFPCGSAIEALYEDGEWYAAVVAKQEKQKVDGECCVKWEADGSYQSLPFDSVREMKKKEKKSKKSKKEKKEDEAEDPAEETPEKQEKKDKKDKKKVKFSKEEEEEEAPSPPPKKSLPVLTSTRKPLLLAADSDDSDDDDLIMRALSRKKK
eukprot:TRINITY_DN4716_c0_g1_i5.p1 TRINITY_DN4716_c0_g1~~TRINITY_DN4716_c0_g1_i5.p1  ORF type:complete len:1104 (+),score=471.16 TRINITY_DN4716_c0_g1_i5:304-3615(+)